MTMEPVSTRDPLFGPDFLGRLEQLALVARGQRGAGGAGGVAGRKIGDGLEFADHREYQPGDELRYLDWPAYGRLGKLFIRQFHQHADRVLHVLLDCSASMAVGAGESALGTSESSPRLNHPPQGGREREAAVSKFDAARRIAAALAYLALNNLDRAAIAGFHAGVPDESISTLRGRDQIFGLMNYLERLQAEGTGGWVTAVRRFAERTREPGLVVIVSDLMEDAAVEPALDALAARGHETFAVQVLAPSEADPTISPDFRGRVRMIDAEAGDEAKLTVSASLADAYRAEASEWFAELDRSFAARRGALVRTTSDVPFERFLLDLIRRGLVAVG